MAAEASSPAAPAAGATGGRRDGLLLLTIWIVLSVIGCLLVGLAWGPHLPPGAQSSSAASQQTDVTVLAVIATPVIIGVLLYFAWAMVFWRRKPGDETDAEPIHGNTRLQATWITVTSAIVLALAVYGTYELISPAGAGAGEGPQPIWKPAGTVAQTSFSCQSPTAAPTWKPGTSNILQVQVIGQQWAWTYRYPQFGCFETTQLVLPVGEPVQFNVTSLDVIHSFWPYELGVKADANPGVNNVAYTTPRHLGQFVVRCDELCGIWHGAMFNYGHVVADAAFMKWAQSAQVSLASVTKMLPPYALTYDPTVLTNVGKVNQQLGLTSAGGGFYNPADPEQP
jgi:cytochrome c oxidase subunit II